MRLIFFCLLGVYRPTREFFTYTETSPLPVKGCKFWPLLGTHSHWTEFFSVPHLLWNGASVQNGYLRGPVTLTLIAEGLAVELSLPVFATYVCRGWDSNTQPSACGANALTHCATTAAISFEKNMWHYLFIAWHSIRSQMEHAICSS